MVITIVCMLSVAFCESLYLYVQYLLIKSPDCNQKFDVIPTLRSLD